MNKLTLVILGLAVALVSCARGPKSCAVCQRDECTGMAFRVTLADGKSVETCCPRCGLHYLETSKQSATRMEATDYTSGKWIDARMAFYVSGSDVSPCASGEIRRDAQGCCLVKGFDRCLPSLIAFQSREAGQKFEREHGGSLVSFDAISES